MKTPDGKMRETDCANVQGLLRIIIQSIPSPKAEPFKKWPAKVAYERIQEMHARPDHLTAPGNTGNSTAAAKSGYSNG